MKPTLKPGLIHRFAYAMPANKTVPCLYPEAADFVVDAAGARDRLLRRETFGMDLHPAPRAASRRRRGQPGHGHVDVSHTAPTPPGLTITVDAECTAVDGRKVSFRVRAHDGVDLIGEGRHERFVVAWDRFNAKVADKARAAVNASRATA